MEGEVREMTCLRSLPVIAVFLVALFFPLSVSNAGYIYDFEVIETYDPVPGLDTYMVVDNGDGMATFTFYNISSIDSSIARIYFDDGSLLGISAVVNGPGTDFNEVFPGPGNLPGGETIGFYADREFSIGAVSPPPENGVNNLLAGEWVQITFELIEGGTLEDVIEEIDSGVLCVGLHVIDLPGDPASIPMVNVPEPATVALFASGFCVLTRRRV